MYRIALLSLALVSAPALASATLQAEPAARPSQERFVARDNVWRCGDAGCVSTNRTATRPTIACAALAHQVGALRSFSADGRAFGPEELETCNRRAH
jgi:hypothetical protein